jgi:hypothetical protein
MRELKVLKGGHLKLSWSERKAFFEEEVGEVAAATEAK